MRSVLVALLVLIAIWGAACWMGRHNAPRASSPEVSSPAPEYPRRSKETFSSWVDWTGVASPVDDPWRRTENGWERIDQWEPPAPRQDHVHPAVVATLELLISLGALVGLSPHATASSRIQVLVT